MSNSKPKPIWWPDNPYPEKIFPMQLDGDEYGRIVPDPLIRTRLSGALGREFWEIASKSIWDAMCANADEEKMLRQELPG